MYRNEVNNQIAGLDWDDLRLCLMVARAGTASGASQMLGVVHSTIVRRVAALEDRLGRVIFMKGAHGYTPTDLGAQLVTCAERVEAQVAEALVDATADDAALRGPVRIALPDITGGALLQELAAFCEAHPEIMLQIEAGQRADTLTRGQAHVAVVTTEAAPQGQLGAPIGPVAFAAYATRRSLESSDVEDLAWIALDPALYHTAVGRFERRLAPPARRHVADTLQHHHAAILAGLGVGLLPCSTGDSDARLRRCGPLLQDAALSAWVLHRRDFRGNARIVALARHLRRRLSRHRDLIAGARPSGLSSRFPSLERAAALRGLSASTTG